MKLYQIDSNVTELKFAKSFSNEYRAKFKDHILLNKRPIPV